MRGNDAASGFLENSVKNKTRIRFYRRITNKHDKILDLCHNEQSKLMYRFKMTGTPAPVHNVNCICITDEKTKEIISVICFDKYEDSYGVIFGCTAESYRGMGYYRRLFNGLVRHAKKDGVNFIYSNYNEKNEESKLMHEALGRKKTDFIDDEVYTVFDIAENSQNEAR